MDTSVGNAGQQGLLLSAAVPMLLLPRAVRIVLAASALLSTAYAAKTNDIGAQIRSCSAANRLTVLTTLGGADVRAGLAAPVGGDVGLHALC